VGVRYRAQNMTFLKCSSGKSVENSESVTYHVDLMELLNLCV